ncbi:hypothetical protein TNCV_662301 [Trichonephila clavipes]|nr:hypothetical protein TNCV_662301 [Trichonephila clavipes]
MATGSSLTQNYSRSESEIQGDLHMLVIGNFSPYRDSSCRSNVSKPQTVWLQAIRWLHSDQHTAITGTKAESE